MRIWSIGLGGGKRVTSQLNQRNGMLMEPWKEKAGRPLWRRLPPLRILVSLVLLYLSAGFFLTVLLRWPQLSPGPGQADFVSMVFNAKLYVSAISWPFWMIRLLT